MMRFFKKKEFVKVEPYIPKNNLTIQEIEDLFINGDLELYNPNTGLFVKTDGCYDGIQSMIKILGSEKTIGKRRSINRLQLYIIALIIKKITQQKR